MNRLELVTGFVTLVLEHEPWSLEPLGQGVSEIVPSKMRRWKSEVGDGCQGESPSHPNGGGIL